TPRTAVWWRLKFLYFGSLVSLLCSLSSSFFSTRRRSERRPSECCSIRCRGSGLLAPNSRRRLAGAPNGPPARQVAMSIGRRSARMPEECAAWDAKASCKELREGCNNICNTLEMKDILRAMESLENDGKAVRDEMERVLSSGGFVRSERVS